MLNNKRGQVSESITWIVATVILIVLLIIFIYASVLLAKTKSLKVDIKLNSEDSADWIGFKTEMAYFINGDNKNKIESWVLGDKKDE